MAILKSKDETRSELFYNKYIYRATFSQPGLGYTRYAITLNDYNKYIKTIKEHAKVYSFIPRVATRGELGSYWDTVKIDIISQYLNWKAKHKKHIIIRLEQDSVSIFFNDIKVLDDLEEFIPEDITLTRIALQETGKMFFKKTPKYNYRMYFKSNIHKFREELTSFIKTNAGNKDLHFSKSMLELPIGLLRYAPYYHYRGFIEYNSESTLTLLHMYFSGAIGKVYKLEKAPE